MKKEKQSTSKIILRVLGAILGTLSIVLSALNPGTLSISTVNVITFMVMGILFLLYGITGKSSFRDK